MRLFNSNWPPASRIAVLLVGCLDLVVAGLTAIGRVSGMLSLQVSFGTQYPMALNGALVFVGVGLWLLTPPTLGSAARTVIQVLAGATFVFVTAILSETILGVDFGIDWAALHGQYVVEHPGRLAWHTAVALMLLSASISLSSLPVPSGRSARVVAAGWLASASALIGGLGLVGYALDLEAFYAWYGVVRMAMPTALLLFLSGIAIVVRIKWWDSVAYALRSSERRIVATSALLLVAVAIVSVGAGITALQHSSLDTVKIDLLQIANANRDLVVAELATTGEIARTTARDPLLLEDIAKLASTPGDASALAILRSRTELLSVGTVRSVSIVNADGTPLVSTVDEPQQLSLPLAGTLKGSRLVWTSSLELLSDFPVVVEGRHIATVEVRSATPAIARILASRSRKTDETILCGEVAGVLGCLPDVTIPRVHRSPRMNGSDGLFPVARAIAGKTGVVRVNDFSGHGVLAAYIPVGSSGLGMVQKIDVAEVYATLGRRLLIAIGLPIAAIVAGIFLLARVVQPIVARIVRAERESRAAQAQIEEGERRLRDITDNIPIRIVYLASDGTITFANKAFAEFAGQPLDRIVGKKQLEILGEAFSERSMPSIARGLKGESIHYERTEVVEGIEQTHDIRYDPDFDAAGRVRGLYGMSYDITSLKAAEQALAASEKHFRAVTDNLPAVVAYVDSQERYQSMNASISRIGMTPADFVGKTMQEVLVPAIYASTKPFVDEVLAGKHCLDEGAIVIREKHYFHRTEYVPDLAIDGTVKGFFVMALDTTEQKVAEQKLRQSEETFRQLVEGVTDYSIMMLDPDGFVATWNEGAQRIEGYAAEEILGHHMSQFYPSEALALNAPARLLNTALKQGRAQDEGWRVRKNGQRFWALVSITAVRDEFGDLRGFSEIVRDRTENRLAEQTLKARELQLRTITDNVPVLICYIDRDHVFRFNNGAYSRWLKKPIEEITNRPIREIYGDEVYAKLLAPLERALAGEATRFEVDYRGWDGTRRYARGTYVPDLNVESGAVIGVHGLITDVTATKRAEEELVRAAETDMLTGLPNRKHLSSRIRDVMESPFSNDSFSVLMFLDLDHFKTVNDELGHQGGDDVLKEFSRRIREVLRPTDVVGRLGGDEFIVMLTALHKPEDAGFVARKILRAMRVPFTIGARSVDLTTSIGIAPRLANERDVSDWLKRADEALYQVKASGRDAFRSA